MAYLTRVVVIEYRGVVIYEVRTMKTLIQGGWVVGYDGDGHELLPGGVVVVILEVGQSLNHQG